MSDLPSREEIAREAWNLATGCDCGETWAWNKSTWIGAFQPGATSTRELIAKCFQFADYFLSLISPAISGEEKDQGSSSATEHTSPDGLTEAQRLLEDAMADCLRLHADKMAMIDRLIGYDAEDLGRAVYEEVNGGRGGPWASHSDSVRYHWRSVGIAAARHLARPLLSSGALSRSPSETRAATSVEDEPKDGIDWKSRALEAERERDAWRETSNGHRDDAEQFQKERLAAESQASTLVERVAVLEGAVKELLRQIERPNSEWDNIRIAAEAARSVLMPGGE